MAFQTINNGELLNVIRTKINDNFTQSESAGNKTQVISSTPSTTKYPSEKAVSDFASKIYSSSSIPTSKAGDLLLHANAPLSVGGSKGKIKFNSGSALTEFIPDRSVCDYRSSSSWSSSNPVLLAGEIGIDSDTGKQKVGNGSSQWNSLTYVGGISASGSNGIFGVKLNRDEVVIGGYCIQFNTTQPGCSSSTDFARLEPTGRATILQSGIYQLSAQFHQSEGFSKGVFSAGIHVTSPGMNSELTKGFENYNSISEINSMQCDINASGAVYLSSGDIVYVYVVPPDLSNAYRLDSNICKLTIVKLG